MTSKNCSPGHSRRRDLHSATNKVWNCFITPALKRWCHLTSDLQIVQPSTIALDTTVVVGMRLEMEF